MLHCRPRAVFVREIHCIERGRFLAGVNQNQRSAVVDRGKRHTGIQARSVDNLAVEQLPGERVVGQRVFGGIRRVPGLLHERRQPARGGFGDERFDEFGVERRIEFVDDDVDDVAAAGLQHAGRQIDAVIELFGHCQHFGARGILNTRLAVQRIRGGHGGDPGGFRYVAQCWFAARHNVTSCFACDGHWTMPVMLPMVVTVFTTSCFGKWWLCAGIAENAALGR